MRSLPQRFQAGFTLVEIMVIAPIVILAIGAFITVVISMTGEVLASRGSNALAYNVQDAMNRIDQDVRQSTSFLAQNNITLTAGEAQGYNDDATNFTNVGGTSGTSLILSMLVTNGNPISTSSGVVYLADQPNACASDQVQDNTPMQMNVVYFVKNNTMWRRTIMPSNYGSSAIRCSLPWQQPTCTPGYVAVFCKTNDTKLIEGVSSTGFNVQYFTSAGATTPNTAATDTANSADTRNAALSSTTTANISISASQSVAGRTIERAATLRTTRLETNASTIAPVVPTTLPSTPAPKGTVANGESASFTWPTSTGNNVVYDVDYNINGGSWTNVLDDSASRSYSRIALRGQTINIRVKGSNSAGSSSYGTTSVLIPLWNTPALQNNWANYDPTIWTTVGYTKTSAGLVTVKGLIKRTGSYTVNETIFTLPPGFRPTQQMIFSVFSNAGQGKILVYPNGDVKANNVDAVSTSLQDISFLSATAGYTGTTLTTLGQWLNWDTVNYGTASYITDSAGRTNVQGTLKGNGTAIVAGAGMVTLSASLQPPLSTYLPAGANGTYGSLIAQPASNNIGIAAGSSSASGYTAINTKFYPASRPAGTDCTISWCTPTLGASWVAYNVTTHQIPQYTKGSDDLVMMRGLMKNGTTTDGTVVFTLPAGYRPKVRSMFQSVCNTLACRIDIASNGNVMVSLGASATWTSFDNVFFIAEQ